MPFTTPVSLPARRPGCAPFPTVRAALLGGAALLMASASAQALEAEDFAAKLNAAYGQSGAGEITFSSATASGDTITLADAALSVPGEEPLKLGEMVFEGITETDDGGYLAETVRVPDVNITEKETTFQISDLQISSLEIPGSISVDQPLADMVFYEQASTGPVTLTTNGKTAFSLEGIVLDLTRAPDDSGFDMAMRASGLDVDLAAVEDPKARETIAALGYERLTGDMTMEAGWDLQTGAFETREMALTLDDVGRLNIAMTISGYTMDFITALQETQEKLAKNAEDPAAGIAMMGLMQQITFNSATIRFDDASITGKALDYVGGQQGVDGDAMAQAIKGMLPLFLGQLQNPEFQKQISDAVGVYLDDPKNLTITANPAEPVPFMALIGAGSQAPQTLPDMLDVTVTANQ